MKIADWNSLNDNEKRGWLQRPAQQDNAALYDQVRDIILTVRNRGDLALRSYAKTFDHVALDELQVSTADINSAKKRITAEGKKAVDTAFKNLLRFHKRQGLKTLRVKTARGIICRRLVLPLERVGLYVPGGSAPLISTTLMLGVPALVAKCPLRVLCTPCGPDGAVNPYILYAAKLCGIDQVFRIGGAQAIAAMAYGTETIPKVDKIFGPGSARVTIAKTLVAQDSNGASIDMPAGPSEVCVIADETTDPIFAAADLLAQAEHDPLSHTVLIALSEQKIRAVQAEIARQGADLPRRDIAYAAIEKSVAIIAQNMEQALEIANAYAPEHLILPFDDAEHYLPLVRHAGSVFLGPWTPETAGDYASGTNHVLPTYGYARQYSGLSVEQYQRSMTAQTLSHTGLENLGGTLTTLARLEGLEAHARAVTLRLAKEEGPR